MMKITYEYSTDMAIVLDDEFQIQYGCGTLDDGVNKACWAMGEYNFTRACIIDNYTNEVLAVIERD